MLPLNVRLFGKLSIRRDDKPVNGLDACKLQELLSYLLVYRGAPHARETLAALLWGDSSTVQSKKYLRQALWHLQSALDSHNNDNGHRVFQVEPDWISLNKDAEIWLDVAVFEQAFARVREVAGQHLAPSAAEALEQAVQLYNGDFLAGWYQDWCVCERERLQTNYLIMLDKLMNYCEAHEKYETGLTYGLTVLRYDRARESTHRRLMRLHYLAGDRTGALRQYEHCAAALKQELGVRPSRHTVALYDQIRSDELQPVAAKSLQTGLDLHPAKVNEHPRIIDHLKRMRRMLIKIQDQVQKDIKAVEQALDGWR